MADLTAFVELGFRHILAVGAADHIVFLLALAAIYRGPDWRRALWVISAFTVGHSVTLVLAVTDVLRVRTAVVEFLIPVTIVLTGIENLLLHQRATPGGSARHRPVFAGVFGLVHGAGFAEYLRNLFVERIAVPLVGFNLGIELGQIVVLVVAATLLRTVDGMIGLLPSRARLTEPFRIRMVAVSALVTIVATGWAVRRWPL